LSLYAAEKFPKFDIIQKKSVGTVYVLSAQEVSPNTRYTNKQQSHAISMTNTFTNENVYSQTAWAFCCIILYSFENWWFSWTK